jgi:hypothetical protein
LPVFLVNSVTASVTPRCIPRETSVQNINSSNEDMNMLRNILKEINRKVDLINQKETVFEKKLENLDKRLGGLIRRINRVSLLLPWHYQLYHTEYRSATKKTCVFVFLVSVSQWTIMRAACDCELFLLLLLRTVSF